MTGPLAYLTPFLELAVYLLVPPVKQIELPVFVSAEAGLRFGNGFRLDALCIIGTFLFAYVASMTKGIFRRTTGELRATAGRAARVSEGTVARDY